MKIVDTVDQFEIMKWVNDNFVKGSVTVKFTSINEATITDWESIDMKIAYDKEKGVYVVEEE